MTLEASLVTAIDPVMNGRFYPDVAPEGIATPYATYQDLGGGAINYLETTLTGKRNARVQINIWSSTRRQASTLAKQIEDVMVISLKAYVLGAAASTYDEETRLFGTLQDFSVWY